MILYHGNISDAHIIILCVLINPRRMRRRVTVVILCVCVSVTMLAATYLVYTSQVRFRRVLYGIFKVLVVWLSLKMLRSRVLA